MKATVVEISGYVPAIMSLYMTGRNVDEERLSDIIETVDLCTNRRGFVNTASHPDDYTNFSNYMSKVIKYGIIHEHETILDFIKISVFVEGMHRGAGDDFDAHAKRMDIIRSSTRANKKSTQFPEISDYYKDKIRTIGMIMNEYAKVDMQNHPDAKSNAKTQNFLDSDGVVWKQTFWGWVREDLENNPDVLRGVVPLSVEQDSISTMSFRNWRHVYHLRRKGTHAAPELQDMVEQVRKELYEKCWWLGYYLGKIWTKDGYEEKNNIIIRRKTINDED